MRALVALLLTVPLVLAGCVQQPGALLDQASTEGAVGAIPALDPVRDLAERVEAGVAAGTPVTVRAMFERDVAGLGALGVPWEYDVVLQPSTVFTNLTWAEVDGARVDMPAVRVYEGHVDGHPDRLVRLTMTDTWARGIIRENDNQFLIRYGLEGNLPFGTVLEHEKESDAATLGLREVPAGTTYDLDGAEPGDCLLLVPPHVTPVIEPLDQKSALAPIVVKMVLDADAQFYEALGPHSFPMMIAFLNEVDMIYEYEVGLRFDLVGVHAHTDLEKFPSPADDAPVGVASEYWNARPDVDRDIVHIFTGQKSDYAMANCIGGAGYPEVAYTFTPLNWARQYVVFHEQAFAHELGHILSAHHHYGNHVESNGGRSLATIMLQGYTPGTKPVFSTVSKSVIRGWAESNIHEAH